MRGVCSLQGTLSNPSPRPVLMSFYPTCWVLGVLESMRQVQAQEKESKNISPHLYPDLLGDLRAHRAVLAERLYSMTDSSFGPSGGGSRQSAFFFLSFYSSSFVSILPNNNNNNLPPALDSSVALCGRMKHVGLHGRNTPHFMTVKPSTSERVAPAFSVRESPA